MSSTLIFWENSLWTWEFHPFRASYVFIKIVNAYIIIIIIVIIISIIIISVIIIINRNQIQNLLESNPLKSILLVYGLIVRETGPSRGGVEHTRRAACARDTRASCPHCSMLVKP